MISTGVDQQQPHRIFNPFHAVSLTGPQLRISCFVPSHLEFTVEDTPIRIYAQEPDARHSPTRTAIVLLHGSGGNLDFWTSRLGPALREAGIALYAPHYFDRTGTARADLATISDGVHVPQWLATVDEAVRFTASQPGIDPDRIVLAGISLGAFLSLAFAAQLSASPSLAERKRLRAVIDVSGGLVAPYAALATEHFAPTLIVHGANDTVVPVSHATSLDRQLTELNVSHRTEILPKEGHWFTASALPRLLRAVSSFLEAHAQPKRDEERAM